MSETLSSSPQDAEGRLFDYREGAYGARVTYGQDEADSDANGYQPPEKPKRLEEMTADEMIELALQDSLAPDIYGHFNEKRGDFLRLHRGWTPYGESEATAAIGGGLTNYLKGANARGGTTAVRDVLADVDRWRAQAVQAVDTLRLIQNVETGEFNAQSAKDSLSVRQTLARAILARNALNLFEWPKYYDKRVKELKENRKTAAMLLAVTDKLAGLDDAKLADLCMLTLRRQQSRLDFWARQVDKARSDTKLDDLLAGATARV